MDIAEARERVLKLVGQYTEKGQQIAYGANSNIADYAASIVPALDAAQKFIARIDNIVKTIKVNAEEYNVMPDDTFKILYIGVRTSHGVYKAVDYDFIEPNEVFIPKQDLPDGDIVATYAATPVTINENTPSDQELELSDVAQIAMLYYASALVVQLDNYSAYTAFMQMYEQLMSNISATKPRNDITQRVIKIGRR